MPKSKRILDSEPIKEITLIDTPILTPKMLLACRKSLGYSQRQLGIELSKVNDDSLPHTPGYISNLENGNQPITRAFERSMQNLLKVIDAEGEVAFIDGTIRYHPKSVNRDSLFAGRSKPCKRDDCDNDFIPTSPNQKQCPECKQRKRKS